jgi:hypothetical protein
MARRSFRAGGALRCLGQRQRAPRRLGRAAFLVGQDNATASDRLQPFRLDLGPRVWDAIGQRALEIPETL